MIKKCMKKCGYSGYDFNLALLALLSILLTSELPSLADLLQSQRFRTTIPTHVPNPSNSEFLKNKLVIRQVAAADHYDKTAREKIPLVPGQPIRLNSGKSMGTRCCERRSKERKIVYRKAFSRGESHFDKTESI